MGPVQMCGLPKNFFKQQPWLGMSIYNVSRGSYKTCIFYQTCIYHILCCEITILFGKVSYGSMPRTLTSILLWHCNHVKKHNCMGLQFNSKSHNLSHGKIMGFKGSLQIPIDWNRVKIFAMQFKPCINYNFHTTKPIKGVPALSSAQNFHLLYK